MCCLRYEHEFYVQSRKRFPKEAKVLVTARGEEKVVANDIFNERVTLRNIEGETRVVSLADLKREMAGGPMTVEEPVVEEEPDMMMELDEEVIRMTDTAERPAYRPGMRPGMPGFPKAPERPVTLQRRESEKREPGNRDRGTGNGSTDVSVRQPASSPGAPPPQPPAGSADDESTTAPAANAGAEGQRPRRRRGRRGGRRGRGRGDGSAAPNSGTTDATSADPGAAAGDSGDDEDGDEA